MSSIPFEWDLPQVAPAVREWLRLRVVIPATPEIADQMRALDALDRVEHAMSPAEREMARQIFWQYAHPDTPYPTWRASWGQCACFACRLDGEVACN